MCLICCFFENFQTPKSTENTSFVKIQYVLIPEETFSQTEITENVLILGSVKMM